MSQECHWNYLVIIPFHIRNGSVHYKAYYVCFHVSLIKLAPQFYLDVPSATNPLISNILLDWNYVVTTIMFFHMCEIGNWVKFCQIKVCRVFFKPSFWWYKNLSFSSVYVMLKKYREDVYFVEQIFLTKI